MTRQVETGNAPAAIGPYSQAIVIDNYIFTSGQIPINPLSGEVVENSIQAQAKMVMENVKAVLIAGGSDMNKVIKTTCFLQDMDDFAEFNIIYAKYFTGNPARSCVAVKALPKGVLCEVEAIAFIRED